MEQITECAAHQQFIIERYDSADSELSKSSICKLQTSSNFYFMLGEAYNLLNSKRKELKALEDGIRDLEHLLVDLTMVDENLDVELVRFVFYYNCR